MSEQAEKFLAQWEIEHIKMVARSDRQDQAQRLALRCREDAARAGISGQDLEAAAEGNLIGNMLQALEYDLLYFKSLGIHEDRPKWITKHHCSGGDHAWLSMGTAML